MLLAQLWTEHLIKFLANKYILQKSPVFFLGGCFTVLLTPKTCPVFQVKKFSWADFYLVIKITIRKNPRTPTRSFQCSKKNLVIFVWYRGWFILPNIYFGIICNKPIFVRIPIYIYMYKPIRISWFMSFPGFLRLLPLRFTWPDSRWPISGELEPIGPWGSNRLGSSVPARRVNGGGVKQKIPGGFSWVFPKNRGFHPKSSKF